MEITYKGFILGLTKRTALDGLCWYCIQNLNTKTIVAKFKKKKDCVWQLQNFDKHPILPV